jgi:uncharacterized protein (DUF305 family)
MARSRFSWTFFATLLAIVALFGAVTPASAGFTTIELGATPATSLCSALPKNVATPTGEPGGLGEMPASPVPLDEGQFDLVFLDLLTRLDESAVVMSQVALDRAEHYEIQQLANEIVSGRTAEIARLQLLRRSLYPDAEELPVDQMDAIVAALAEQMIDQPNLESLRAASPSSAFIAMCEAPEPFDLAYIDAQIANNQTAIALANVALEHSLHDEVKALVSSLIESDQQEIDSLLEWRASWYASATPAPWTYSAWASSSAA